jgi:hypothetical protein
VVPGDEGWEGEEVPVLEPLGCDVSVEERARQTAV